MYFYVLLAYIYNHGEVSWISLCQGQPSSSQTVNYNDCFPSTSYQEEAEVDMNDSYVLKLLDNDDMDVELGCGTILSEKGITTATIEVNTPVVNRIPSKTMESKYSSEVNETYQEMEDTRSVAPIVDETQVRQSTTPPLDDTIGQNTSQENSNSDKAISTMKSTVKHVTDIALLLGSVVEKIKEVESRLDTIECRLDEVEANTKCTKRSKSNSDFDKLTMGIHNIIAKTASTSSKIPELEKEFADGCLGNAAQPGSINIARSSQQKANEPKAGKPKTEKNKNAQKQCIVCGKTLCDVSAVNKHFAAIHAEYKKFKCPSSTLCSYETYVETSYNYHWVRKHSRENKPSLQFKLDIIPINTL